MIVHEYRNNQNLTQFFPFSNLNNIFKKKFVQTKIGVKQPARNEPRTER